MDEPTNPRGLTQRLAAAYSVSRILTEGGEAGAVLERALRVIGSELGWDFCSFWWSQPGSDNMRMAASWQREPARTQALENAARTLTLAPGKGWTGQVWEAGEPQWIEDIGANPEFVLRTQAVAGGLGVGVGYPILIQGRVAGILELLAARGTRPDSDFMAILVSLGEQIGIFLDRSRTAAALRASEAHFRLLFDLNIAGVHCSTLAGETVLVNAAFVRMLGFASDLEALHCTSSELYVDEEDREALLRQLQITGRDVNRQLRLRRRDGRLLWVLANTVLIPGRDGGPAFNESTIIDITESKDLQQRLWQSSKLESMGRLASGIAHDFNNLLTVINGYGELALSRMGAGDGARAAIEKMREAGQRAASLTGNLLAFGRRQAFEPAPVDLEEAVRGTMAMLAASLSPAEGPAVRVEMEVEPGLGRIRADRGQIGQIVMNLALNARDAMPGGGSLLLQMSNRAVGEDYHRRHVQARAGNFVLLEVSDTGSGMSAETIERVFEPFFTTKARGKGTGLGLSTVYGLVLQHGGWIELYSEVGQGTTFKVYFPQAESPATSTAPARAEAEGRGECLALVEDKAEVRILLQQMLEGQGYRVLAAGDCAQVAAMVGRVPAHAVQLLITDMILPDGNGPELAAQLALPTLYTSGYPLHALIEKGQLPADHPMDAFLQKPFAPQEALGKIRAMLGAHAAAGAGA